MIKILHTGDLHVTEGPRFSDDARVLDAIVASGREAGVQAWIVAGDLTGTTVPHRMSPAERNRLAETFVDMARTGPVIIVYGNHDFPGDLDVFAMLRSDHPIRVVASPEVVQEMTNADDVIKFYCLPYPSKRFLLAEAIEEGVEGQKATAEDHLRAILGEWAAEARTLPSDADVFVGHVNVGGSLVAGGEVMIGREIELGIGDLQDLRAAGINYFALSHIHLAQEVAEGAFYAGSPTGHNFGETDPKGWNVVEIDEDGTRVVRVSSPARRLITVRVEGIEDEGAFLLGLPEDLKATDVRDAEVRLRISIPEEYAATADVDDLVARMMEMDPFRITVERIIVPTVRIRSEAVESAGTMREAVDVYLREMPGGEYRNETIERVLAKYDGIQGGE